jgi:hypothetical protein
MLMQIDFVSVCASLLIYDMKNVIEIDLQLLNMLRIVIKRSFKIALQFDFTFDKK